MDFTRLSVAEIGREVRGGGGEAAMTRTLARMTAYDAVQPCVWISRFADHDLLHKARAVDARLAAGEDLPLAGVPFAVKDNIDVAGLPTTAACPAFSYRPERSAVVVSRLEAAGAIAVGKTNLDQFATGLVGVRSPYGAPACVFNRAYVSGGSSSGSAVAVAAGLVGFALGTDTAGSGRVPAAFNGLVGLKPSKGRWSTTGLVPACRSLDCITVFAGNVQDARLVDRVVTAFDPDDPYSRRSPDPPPTTGKGFSFGVPRGDQLRFFGDAASASLFIEAKARLVAIGGVAKTVDIQPLLDAAQLLYAGPWVAERALAAETLLRKDPGAIHPVVRSILLSGLEVSGLDAFRGAHRLQALARKAEQMWDEADLLLLPTTPTIYRIDEVLADPVALNANLGLYTNFVNLLDMAAVAAPAGHRENGTGFGITLIGPAFSDHRLLDIAQRYLAGAPIALPDLDVRPALSA